MGVSDSTEKLSVIPYVFYDLISRIPAGVIVLLSVYLMPSSPLPTLPDELLLTTSGAVILPIVGLVVAYVLGLALSASGPIVFPILDALNSSQIREGLLRLALAPRFADGLRLTINDLSAIEAIGSKEAKRGDITRLRTKLHTYLKVTDSRVGMEMAKHQAEVVLFTNLGVASTLFALFLLLREYFSTGTVVGNPGSGWLISTLLTGIAAFTVAVSRNRICWRYHFAYAEFFLQNATAPGAGQQLNSSTAGVGSGKL